MIFLIYICIPISILFSSDLSNWISSKKKLISDSSYKLSFDYSFHKNKDSVDKEMLINSEFLSINQDSSIIVLNDRFTLCFNDRWETIDINSKQKFIEPNDEEFNNLKNKLSSIFTQKKYKLIKISKNRYYLSLNDYYINMEINYSKDNNYISQIFFYQAPYWIYIKDLSISSIDSVINYYYDLKNYEVFDFR